MVVVTGTGFTDFPDTDSDYDVEFVAGGIVARARLTFDVHSATEIWATVPDLTPGTAYTIRVTNDGGTGSSTATFTGHGGRRRRRVRANDHLVHADMCIVGNVVMITGTNLLRTSDLTGGDVRFSPVPGGPGRDGICPMLTTSDVTQCGRSVGRHAGDGPIRVNTFTRGRRASLQRSPLPGAAAGLRCGGRLWDTRGPSR